MNRSQLLDLVVRLASTLSDDFSVRAVLDRLAEELAAVLPVVGVGVLLVDPDGEHHLVASACDAVRRIEGLPIVLDEGPCLVAYRTSKPVVVTSSVGSVGATEVLAAALHDAAVRTVLSLPIRRGAERFGALEIYATSPCDAAATDLGNWQMLADVVALYLSIAHRREDEMASVERLEQAALHDPLTGLPNRRLLEDRLHQARERTRRTGAVYAVLFCDLDGFKLVNDRLGHQAGDRLLVELSQRLDHVVRPHDSVARVSGDEFVILCEDLDGPGLAKDVAQRVLAAVDVPFAMQGTDEEVRVGISIGIAVASAGAPESYLEILSRADAAMYQAKEWGGRRAEVAAPALIDVRQATPARASYIAAS